jgi:hypothetical protein
LDIVSHLPRAVYSKGDLEVMLWLLRINGARDVPSMTQLQSAQECLEGVFSPEVKRHMGSLGHVYYVLRPSSTIKMVSMS